MFELGDVDDLVLPGPGSTTGRALASMARRRLFERLKALARESRSSAGEARSRLAGSFAARLPGNPHAISDAISDPAIGVLLRRGLRGGPDAPWLALGIERLLIALGDLDATAPPPAAHPIAGPIGLRDDDLLAEAAGIARVACDPEAMTHGLSLALDRLEQEAPSMRTDLDRLATAVFVASTPAEAVPPYALGVAVVPSTYDPARLAEALAASLVIGKLHALVEARAHAPAVLERLRPLAAEVAALRSHGRGDSLADGARSRLRQTLEAMKVAEDDPLHHPWHELRAIAERGRLLP